MKSSSAALRSTDPAAVFLSKRVVRPVVFLLAAVAAAALVAHVVMSPWFAGATDGLDSLARRAASLHGHTAINRAMVNFTHFGDEIVMIVASTVLAGWTYLRTRTSHWPAFVTIAMTGALALDNLIKPLVERARPDFDRLVGGRGPSFPSGHATAATAFCVVVALYLSRNRGKTARRIIWSVAALVALTVGISRIYVGVHWPTDVAAGMILGATWAAIAAYLERPTRTRSDEFEVREIDRARVAHLGQQPVPRH